MSHYVRLCFCAVMGRIRDRCQLGKCLVSRHHSLSACSKSVSVSHDSRQTLFGPLALARRDRRVLFPLLLLRLDPSIKDGYPRWQDLPLQRSDQKRGESCGTVQLRQGVQSI
eukprot:6238445-Amphidinium_carterae.1